jgi:hypothetical protein
MNTTLNTCLLLEDYLDGHLSKTDKDSFTAHLAECDDCREQVRVSGKVRELFNQHLQNGLSDDADLRLRMALQRERYGKDPAKDVMNLEETAVWLGITPGALAERLDEIPAFEIGGRIRFSRKRLEKWMEMKDGDMRLQMQQSHVRNDNNLLPFPGGKHGKQQSGNSGAV